MSSMVHPGVDALHGAAGVGAGCLHQYERHLEFVRIQQVGG
jgi:hypothetical protein